MEEELKRLISENKVIPFVGAGVSKEIKYKTGENIFVNWKELLEILNQKVTDENKRSGIEFFLKSKNVDYLQIADMIEKELTPNEFNEKLKEIFDIDFNEVDNSTLELAKTIWELNCKLIITTNYDKVLYHSCSDANKKFWDIEAIHEQATSLRDGISHSTIWHLHGHIDNVNNIILTSQKYNELYTIDSSTSRYKSALETLRTTINTKSLLFIGFSLDDEFVVNQLNRTIDIFGGNSHEHYVLCKKGSKPNTLNKNIKVIEYENHGQPLIDKIKSLAPISTNNENKIEEKISIQTIPSSTQHEANFLTVLPEVKNDFIGRVDELAKIKEMLSNDNISCIVNGIGGVGKSELALKYFHDNKHNYNNVAFIQLTQDTTSIENVFFQAFQVKLNLQPETLLSTILLQLQGLRPKNLILIDNLEKKEDFDKVKCLNTSFDILLTTRLQNIESKYQINLETLNDTDAKELFLRIYNKDENIKDVLKYLDNHPLFITLLASSIKSNYITLEELRKNIKNNTISKIDSKDDKTFKEHLIDTFERQFVKESNEDLKNLLQILSIFPSMEIKFEIFEKILTVDNLKVKLQKLVERGWLIQNDSSYKLHQIIKTFLQEEHKVEYENISYILQNITNYINPDDSTLIVNKLNDYIPIIDELLEKFESLEDENICGILDSQTYLYILFGQYNKSLEFQNKSLRYRIKIYGENDFLVAKNRKILSIIYRNKGDFPTAIYNAQKSLFTIKKLTANPLYVISEYNNLSLIYHNQRNLSKALKYSKKEIKLIKIYSSNKNELLSLSYNNISMIYQDMNNLKKALNYSLKALKIKEELLNKYNSSMAISYNNISLIYKELGKLEQALFYIKKALNIREEFESNSRNLAQTYNNISAIYQDMKEYEEALNYSEKDIELIKKIFGTEHIDLYYGYRQKSLIYKDLDDSVKSEEYLKKAMNIERIYLK